MRGKAKLGRPFQSELVSALESRQYLAAPVNDDFANATVVGDNALVPGSINKWQFDGSTVGATTEVDEPQASGGSIWWQWTAPASSWVSISSSAWSHGLYLTVFAGDADATLASIDSFDLRPSVATFPVEEGRRYFIRASGCEMDNSITLESGLPGPVEGFTVTSSSATHVSLAWKASAGTTTYSLSRGTWTTDPITGSRTCEAQPLVELAGNATEYTDVEVNSGDNYLYFLTARRGDSRQSDGYVDAWALPAPANDRLSDAVDIVSGERVEGSTQAAHAEPAELSLAEQPAEHSVWYRWTADRSGFVFVQIESDFEARLAIYTVTASGALELVGSNAIRNSVPGPRSYYHLSVAHLEAQLGTEYLIAVDGIWGQTGDFSFTVPPLYVPSTDDPAHAVAIEDSSLVDGSTSHWRITGTAGAGTNTQWWTWTADRSSSVEIEAEGYLTIHPAIDGGPSSGNLGNGRDVVRFAASEGATYFIRVNGNQPAITLNLVSGLPFSIFPAITDTSTRSISIAWTPQENVDRYLLERQAWQAIGNDAYAWQAVLVREFAAGTSNFIDTDVVEGTRYQYRLQTQNSVGASYWSASVEAFALGLPPNDNRANAIELQYGVPVLASTYRATVEPDEPLLDGVAPDRSVWYRWTADHSGWVGAGYSVAAETAKIAIFAESEETGFTLLTSMQPWDRELTFPVTEGTTYYVGVFALPYAPQLLLTLWLASPPANDNFTNAFAIGEDALVEGAIDRWHVSGRTSMASGETGEPGVQNPSEHTVWWKWTATHSDLLSIKANKPVFVYAGDAGATLDSLNPAIAQSYGPPFFVKVEAGKSYFFQVWNTGINPTATLDIEGGFPYQVDDLAVTSATATGVTLSWSGQSNLDTYRIERQTRNVEGWTDTGTFTISGAATTFIDLNVSDGQLYRYRVAAVRTERYSSWSDWRLADISIPPANDDLVNATVVGDEARNPYLQTRWYIKGTLRGASVEPDEPEMSTSNPPSATAWWKWTAPDTSWVRISSSIYMSIYSSTLDTKIASRSRSAVFLATAGTTYLIQIGNVGCEPSSLAIHITSNLPAPVALSVAATSHAGIVLAWPYQPGVNYTLQRSASRDDSTLGTGTEIYDDPPRFTDANVDAGSSYWYRILARNASGESEWSAWVEATAAVPPQMITVGENPADGVFVGRVTAANPNGSLRYEFISGNETGAFTLNPTTGAIRVANSTAIDFERIPFFDFSVLVSDSEQPGVSESILLRVNVLDINEAPSALAISSHTMAENASPESVVGMFTTSDVDVADSFSYTLIEGGGDADNNRFEIVGNELRVRQPLNYEAQESYSIRVQVSDSGGLALETVFTISVTDVNEAPLSLSLSSTRISEHRPAYTIIGNLSTIDRDADDAFTYALVAQGDYSAFLVQNSMLLARYGFDYESKRQYSISIRGTDAGGLFIEQPFTITLTNITETRTVPLLIRGTSFQDTISLSMAGNRLRVLRNGHSSYYDTARLSSITIDALGGNDRITIDPSVRAVKVLAGDGSDAIIGGDNNDSLDGGSGNDTIRGGKGHDRLYGHSGNDRLYGGEGNDRLYGDGGTDYLYGEAGDDELFAIDRTADYITGGAGNDQAHWDPTKDYRRDHIEQLLRS